MPTKSMRILRKKITPVIPRVKDIFRESVLRKESLDV